ncbi:hypothetical protein [Streptomyces sp. CBMA123]|uniref:hypothetical protein n=1 Tax=Streptomyces sp. CBMA123 TaxID=1896313 RepID=UPI00166196C4|nr:hypothetical protein [Streptomyces sp. CBMA123]MBD0694321.1 hypothetical protein [Streptomyces sp. CBMA123]
MTRLKIEISVPESHVEQVVDALHAAGAGRAGEYARCTSAWRITGSWLPSPAARPHLGTPGEVQRADEYRVESFCDHEQAAAVLKAVRAVHPYEEAVVNFLPLYDPVVD